MLFLKIFIHSFIYFLIFIWARFQSERFVWPRYKCCSHCPGRRSANNAMLLNHLHSNLQQRQTLFHAKYILASNVLLENKQTNKQTNKQSPSRLQNKWSRRRSLYFHCKATRKKFARRRRAFLQKGKQTYKQTNKQTNNLKNLLAEGVRLLRKLKVPNLQLSPDKQTNKQTNKQTTLFPGETQHVQYTYLVHPVFLILCHSSEERFSLDTLEKCEINSPPENHVTQF